MQMTIYYAEADRPIIERIYELAADHRMSRSALILRILEHCFEGGKPLPQILVDMGKLKPEQLEEFQKRHGVEAAEDGGWELLVEEGLVERKVLERARAIRDLKL